MKIERKNIPEEIKEVVEEPASKMLKSLKDIEALNTKSNIKAVFFINLTYMIGLILLTFITLQTGNPFAIATIAVTTIGALIFNLFTYNETKRTKKHVAIIKNLGTFDEA